MYDIIKALVWIGYSEFTVLLLILWFISTIINVLTLISFGVKWWWLGLLPFSQNLFKLYFVDTVRIPWILGIIPACVGAFSVFTVSPLGTLIYLIWLIALNYLFCSSVYNEGAILAACPVFRWYIQVRESIEALRG